MLWPWFLAAALAVLGLGLCARDRLSVWMAGLWAVGIILTALTGLVDILEPWRWLYAVAIWTTLAVIAACRYGAENAALCFWLIPVGYFLLAVGTGPLWIWHGITEIAGVMAVVIGGRGIPNGIRNRIHGRSRSGILAMGRGLADQNITQTQSASRPR